MADDPLAGLNPDFAVRIRALIAASGGKVNIQSGYRSVAQQTALWNQALAKYGSPQAARQWVAPPGSSNHNRGLAVDLGGDLALAHQLAASFGLTFPLGNEAWHIEPAGLRANPNTDQRAYSPNGGQGGGFGDQLDRFMGGLMQAESSGRNLGPNEAGASGYYQFRPGTWANYGGYSQAYLAPKPVQDQRARDLMTSYFHQFGSWGNVAQAWLGGPNSVGKQIHDQYTGISGSDYVHRVLSYAGLDGSTPMVTAPAAPVGQDGAPDRHDAGTQLQSFLSIISNPADLPPADVSEAA